MAQTKDLKVLFQQRRDQAFKALEDRKQEIYTFIPKVKILDQEIKKMGLKIAMAALKNPNDAQTEMKFIEEEIKMLKREKFILLTEHNIPQDYLQVDFICKTCEDTGFLKDGSPCHCYKQELIKRSYTFSNITDVLDRENFSTFDLSVFSDVYDDGLQKSPRDHMRIVLDRALAFTAHFKDKTNDNLLFFGATGLGKTFLCNCIAKELLDNGYTVVYQTAFRIIDTISNYRFTNPKTEDLKAEYDLLITTDLLIIDDLGTEMINSFTNTELFNLINGRLLQDKKTIISTNFTPSQISELYSERISSRLFGHYEFLPFSGQDLRWEV
ncbi:MAG: ATP-binding protein [Clostridia bacterium]|nr:ATP-binding protein [Clostridia bacterium]